MLIAALAGGNFIYGSGMLDMGMTFSLGQLVADNEIARMVRRIQEGIAVNDYEIAAEVTKAVGPGKEFLTHPHTYENLRVHALPELINRDSKTMWLAGGAKTMMDKANEKAIEILETHKPTPLPQSDKIKMFLEDVEREFGIIK